MTGNKLVMLLPASDLSGKLGEELGNEFYQYVITYSPDKEKMLYYKIYPEKETNHRLDIWTGKLNVTKDELTKLSKWQFDNKFDLDYKYRDLLINRFGETVLDKVS